MRRDDLTELGHDMYEIPQNARPDMRGPARIFADESILEKAFADKSIVQLMNTATLPGLEGAALAMPDCHQGYGFPIGGVVATRTRDGVISPGGVGYDINCGVRLLRTQLVEQDITRHIENLTEAIFQHCPSGVGKEGAIRLKHTRLDDVLRNGSAWAVKEGYGTESDLNHTENGGTLQSADSDVCSKKAKERGAGQLGTLGAGNHFIEIDRVVRVVDKTAADALGLSTGQIVMQIHTGSRGFGHQIATDYVARFQKTLQKYEIKIPDRQLVCAPFMSEEGQEYFGAMSAAANYAWANRQILTHRIRQAWKETLGDSGGLIGVVWDIAHNIAKVENHTVREKPVELCVHRKGATRAFGPGHQDIPSEYRHVGQPVLVPGSMGTSSYVLVGTEAAMKMSFGSACHGAGRELSRKAAKSAIRGQDVKKTLQKHGIHVRTGSIRGLAEEAPQAYKDVDAVIHVVQNAGIAKLVAQLEPVSVIKG